MTTWTEQHARKRRTILDLLDETRSTLDQAATPGLSAQGIAGLLRDAETKARRTAAQLGQLAFTFER